MMQSFVITLREGLEAFLIIAISLAYLRKERESSADSRGPLGNRGVDHPERGRRRGVWARVEPGTLGRCAGDGRRGDGGFANRPHVAGWPPSEG